MMAVSISASLRTGAMISTNLSDRAAVSNEGSICDNNGDVSGLNMIVARLSPGAISARSSYNFPCSVASTLALARELVGLQPDIIVTSGTAATAAVPRETRTIPIVFANVADPVVSGLVARLDRPSGNITGFGFWPIAALGVQRAMSATGQSRPTNIEKRARF
jgi:hypothetical protein